MEGFISMDLWHKFKLAELDQVMRQDDDKIRKGEIDENVEYIVKITIHSQKQSTLPG